MKKIPKLTFPDLFKNTVKNYGNKNALAFVGETPIKFKDVEKQILALMAYLENLDIKPNDKVAILSTNMPNWGITYFAITFIGAVAVPLLPDFHQSEIENILNHSEAKAIFVSKGLSIKIKDIKNNYLKNRIKIEDFSIIETDHTSKAYNLEAKPAKEYHVEEDDLATIIYTSGTTGKSKGVMLSHKNISFDAIAAGKVQPINETDRFLSILPLSHTYENTLGLILPMIYGACVYYLRKPPVPAVLLPALKKVKPTLILSVPLIIEKIYRSKILPSFTDKWYINLLYKIPFVRKKLNLIAGKKLIQTFGGKVKFFGIGGAKLDKNVEKFLIEAKFPYAIGYGLTETSPLVAGSNPQNTILQSTGPSVQGIELKIHNPNKKTKEGEIWVKGPNVMKGYYKEPELTKKVLTEDGWFKTGDLGTFDKNNFLFIRGRIKNIIVGASGENIYPEEIESVINNFRHVVESVVVQQKGKLVAMVHFNLDEIEGKYQNLRDEATNFIERKTEDLIKELKVHINTHVNKFSQVQKIILQPIPFKKTATHKI
ncbi:MAG: AMP-binding protein, partial [Bacteroidales bacterium]|nr:AMP-binding protein [Bacteroidales bacterium]